MDLDQMWAVCAKYRPMLDEAYEHWCKGKSEEELNAPRTISGRVIRPEDGEPPIGREPIVSPHHMAAEKDKASMVQPGDPGELEALQDLAEQHGVQVDGRWGVSKLREELGYKEDEPVPAPSELKPGHSLEHDRLREIAKERGVEAGERWGIARLRKELGFGEDDPIPARGSAPPQSQQAAEVTGEMGNAGSTASGAGGQANPAGGGSTGSGEGSQNNPTGTGSTKSE